MDPEKLQQTMDLIAQRQASTQKLLVEIRELRRIGDERLKTLREIVERQIGGSGDDHPAQ